ncbi:MAG TPA: hypothetical protein EYO84_08155, partial [Planctomycetes bacterium]|nr:hypothetical protein [Planctomycetota bacterium]
MELSNNGRRMLKAMREEPSKTWNLTDLLSACDWTDQAHVAGAGAALSEAGLVSQTEARTTLWKLAPEGITAAKNGLLEQRIWDWLSEQSGSPGMAELQTSEAVAKNEAGIG